MCFTLLLIEKPKAAKPARGILRGVVGKMNSWPLMITLTKTFSVSFSFL